MQTTQDKQCCGTIFAKPFHVVVKLTYECSVNN